MVQALVKHGYGEWKARMAKEDAKRKKKGKKPRKHVDPAPPIFKGGVIHADFSVDVNEQCNVVVSLAPHAGVLDLPEFPAGGDIPDDCANTTFTCSIGTTFTELVDCTFVSFRCIPKCLKRRPRCRHSIGDSPNIWSVSYSCAGARPTRRQKLV